MKEKAWVVSSQGELAQVKVNQKEELCNACSARSLCVGQKQTKGTITVLNPLSAQPGDEVKIEIPEESYNKELILIFGALLSAALFGLALGYLFALLLSFPSSQLSFIGFILGLLMGGFLLFRYFRQIKNKRLYPLIIDITRKGDSHG